MLLRICWCFQGIFSALLLAHVWGEAAQRTHPGWNSPGAMQTDGWMGAVLSSLHLRATTDVLVAGGGLCQWERTSGRNVVLFSIAMWLLVVTQECTDCAFVSRAELWPYLALIYINLNVCMRVLVWKWRGEKQQDLFSRCWCWKTGMQLPVSLIPVVPTQGKPIAFSVGCYCISRMFWSSWSSRGWRREGLSVTCL